MFATCLFLLMAAPQPCPADIETYHGAPAIFVNKKPEFAFAYLAAGGDLAKQYKQMADIGVRFFTVPAPLGATPEVCDPPFLQILKQQPNALIFPRVDLTPPQAWLDQHPDDRVVFDDGTKGPQSMFSDAWLDWACKALEDYCRYIRSSPYADHIIGVHPCSGYTGEWQSWGLWDNKRGDFSQVARNSWYLFLTDKYKTNAAITDTWGWPVTLDTADLPSRQHREGKSNLLRKPSEFQDVFDFYDWYWRGTAKALTQLAAAAKRGGGQDFLVGFFYGYEIQYGGKTQESQHLGMRQLLDCPNIDFFCSPAMYTLREPGGTSTFMSFTESCKTHGKFWWDEADNRTHLAKDPVAPAGNPFETLNVLKREFAHVITEKTGMWWFDMQGGWYDDPEILALLKQMREFGESNDPKWEPPHEMAVLVDDQSTCRYAPESSFLNEAITQTLAQMPRAGIPYDTYLLNDIIRSLPEYKLYVFIAASDLTVQEWTGISNLKRDGKNLFFLGPAAMGKITGRRVDMDRTFHDKLFAGAGNWKARWTTNPNLTMEDLRIIAEEAGVHIYHNEDDAFYAGNGFLALHGQTGGQKTITLEKKLHYRELFATAPIEGEGETITFELKPKETRCFAITP